MPLKFVHLRDLVFKNFTKSQVDNNRLIDMLVVGSDTKKINHKMMSCTLFCHKNFKNKTIYVAASLVKITRTGPEEQYFSKKTDVRQDAVEALQ